MCGTLKAYAEQDGEGVDVHLAELHRDVLEAEEAAGHRLVALDQAALQCSNGQATVGPLGGKEWTEFESAMYRI